MIAALRVGLQRVLPQRLLCAVIYHLARTRRPWIKNPLIRWFSTQFGIDLSDAVNTELTDYPSFNAFFTRALKPGTRPIADDHRSIVSPVDGKLTEFGRIDRNQLVQAKGLTYTLEALLAEESAIVEKFIGGQFATIYLAPHNYHRVHAPLAGALTRTRYIPGQRFSVNSETAASISNLFCRNERVVCWFDTVVGEVIAVLVGALNVSSISTVELGELRSASARQWQHDTPSNYAKGTEIGQFNLGSTVVVLFPNGGMNFSNELSSGMILTMGMSIGALAATVAA